MGIQNRLKRERNRQSLIGQKLYIKSGPNMNKRKENIDPRKKGPKKAHS
jgi:hypothetical protein